MLEVRGGAAEILPVSTRREDTLVTVPDCTIRPGGEERGRGGSGAVDSVDGVKSAAAVEAGGAAPSPELVLRSETYKFHLHATLKAYSKDQPNEKKTKATKLLN